MTVRYETSGLTILPESAGEWLVLRLTGNIQDAGVGLLRRALRDAVSAGRPHVVADLSGVRFCDAYGFGALVVGRRLARASRGQLRLVLGGENRRNLDVACLSQLFDVFETVHRATDGALPGMDVDRGSPAPDWAMARPT